VFLPQDLILSLQVLDDLLLFLAHPLAEHAEQ
jgi:hypothetical protein